MNARPDPRASGTLGPLHVGQQEHGFNLRAQLAVHRGHLRFVVEVGQVAGATNDGAGVLLGAKIHDQSVERQHRHACYIFSSVLHMSNKRVEQKQCFS